MATTNRISLVETSLRGACEKARAAGITLVKGAFEVEGGVCALGAYDMFDGKGGWRRT